MRLQNFPKAYVLHCKSLHERAAYMRSALTQLGIESEWITDNDAVELSSSIIKEFYAADRLEAIKRTSDLWKCGSHHDRFLTLGEISIAIKHTNAIKAISRDDRDFGLVLEDDCIFHSDFSTLFHEYLLKTPENWDVIHVGNGYGMSPERYSEVHSKIAYKMNHPASRCAEAYLITKRAATLISGTMQPFHLAADWELGYQYWHHSLNVYWWDPALITQGSHAGIFKSSLR